MLDTAHRSSSVVESFVREHRALDKRANWWRRVGPKGRFRYVTAEGRPVRDRESLARIKSLVIPPAWNDVRISPSPRTPVQAVGFDQMGRLQYRYRPEFLAKRAARKYDKLIRFAKALPQLRAKTNEDIAREGLPRERVLAVMVRLINELYFRVGSERNVEHYRTYGITTLRKKHLVSHAPGPLEFRYVGKHHIHLRRVLVDEELCALVREIHRLRGPRLFCYVGDDGKTHCIRPSDINDYIKTATGAEFTAKDFRTWGGTLLAAIELAEIGPAPNKTQAKRNIVRAVKVVAERLGNTVSVCRKSYIHPAVIEGYANGVTLHSFRPRAERAIRRHAVEYEVEELALLQMLEVVSTPKGLREAAKVAEAETAKAAAKAA
jgi:DNA topoisomerase-1